MFPAGCGKSGGTAGASGNYTCRNCVQVQLLNKHVGELEQQLDDLGAIRENESFLDKTYSEVITPRIQEEQKWVTVRKRSKRGVLEAWWLYLLKTGTPSWERMTRHD